MVRPTPEHIRISMRGTLGTAGTSPETWENIINLGDAFGFGDPPDFDTTLRDDIVADCEAFIGGSANFCSSVKLTEVRFSRIGSNGAQVGVTSIRPASAQGAAGQAGPWQCSNVVSLIAAGRGKGYRGRWFLAPQGFGISQVDGLITPAASDTIADAVEAFINNLNDAPGVNIAGQGKVSIIGQTGSAGTSRRVDRIRVGRVTDTHRSRRRSLAELYTERSIPLAIP